MNGHVKKPGVFECAVGLTLRELIYDLGGGDHAATSRSSRHPRRLVDCPVLRAEDVVHAPDEKSPLHAVARQERPRRAAGRRHVPQPRHDARHLLRDVMAEGTDPVAAFHNLMQFYRHESCGQCTPCREGSGWLFRIADKLIAGDVLDGGARSASTTSRTTSWATRSAPSARAPRCPRSGSCKKFRKEFEAT